VSDVQSRDAMQDHCRRAAGGATAVGRRPRSVAGKRPFRACAKAMRNPFLRLRGHDLDGSNHEVV
jgi:hypothetical protein